MERWVAAGVEWVQVREKDLQPAALESLVCRLAALTGGSATRLLVNGLPARRARECGADGVHLPGSASADAVRAALADSCLVSVSCHTLAEIEAAVEGGVSVIVWAPVFAKVVRGIVVQPGSGLAALHDACVRAREAPVFALGGVTEQNAGACIAAGAAGIAGIRLFAGEGWRLL